MRTGKVEHDEFGREIPDPTVCELPAHLRREESLSDRIRRAIREHASHEAAAAGFETFEEADDFSADDEDDFVSPHELSDMQEDAPISRPAPAKVKEVDDNEGGVEGDVDPIPAKAASGVVTETSGKVKGKVKSGKDKAGDQGDED